MALEEELGENKLGEREKTKKLCQCLEQDNLAVEEEGRCSHRHPSQQGSQKEDSLRNQQGKDLDLNREGREKDKVRGVSVEGERVEDGKEGEGEGGRKRDREKGTGLRRT